jgi:hypothetical protein
MIDSWLTYDDFDFIVWWLASFEALKSFQGKRDQNILNDVQS